MVKYQSMWLGILTGEPSGVLPVYFTGHLRSLLPQITILKVDNLAFAVPLFSDSASLWRFFQLRGYAILAEFEELMVIAAICSSKAFDYIFKVSAQVDLASQNSW